MPLDNLSQLPHDTTIASFILFVSTFPLVCHFISLDLLLKEQQEPFYMTQVIDQSMSAAVVGLTFSEMAVDILLEIKSLLLFCLFFKI